MDKPDFIVSFLPYDGIWTYYTKDNGDIILKGVYKENSELFQQLITRSNILKQWGTPYILHPIGIRNDNGLWLEFPNAIGHFPSEYHLVKADSSNEEDYYLSDELIGTLSRINKSNLKHHTYDLLKVYVHLYIINSGSHTPFTTLIDHNNEIVIPEYTGFSKPVSNKLFYLNKGEYDDSYDEKRYNIFSNFYTQLADEIEDFDFGVGYQLRKEKAIRLLRKYAK